MSKQRVFKLNYLLRGKQHNKRSSTLFQLQKYDCHMLVPSPSVLLTSWSSRFLVFCRFWFAESAGNTVVSLLWLAEEYIDHLVVYLGAGPFKYTFTSQHRTCWNSGRLGTHASKSSRFHTYRTECVVFTPASVPTYLRRFFLSLHYGRNDTGSVHCIFIGCISMLLLSFWWTMHFISPVKEMWYMNMYFILENYFSSGNNN